MNLSLSHQLKYRLMILDWSQKKKKNRNIQFSQSFFPECLLSVYYFSWKSVPVYEVISESLSLLAELPNSTNQIDYSSGSE